jgi:phosphatidate phosphatase APP1
MAEEAFARFRFAAGWRGSSRPVTFSDFNESLKDLLRTLSRPVRRAGARGGIVLQPYRGYGSRERAFLIGRVFRQRSVTPVQGPWDVRRQFRDVVRRLVRRPVAGILVRGQVLGSEAEATTDSDGYFRLEWRLPNVAWANRLWHPVALRIEDAAAEATGEIYIPPESARFVVISDIDDTVMHTGVANKLGMMWRLFVRSAKSRTAFPGVAAFYRALHGGASGDDGNPMLYVSRAPWGIYDVLDEFFQRHAIPVGPVLFLREWGISWRSPMPRRAEDHKRVLIEAIMDVYGALPFVLIGDSGQHDPQIYRNSVERYGDRILAVYIRDVSRRDSRISDEINAMSAAVRSAGSDLILAADTAAMAEHAASRGLISAASVDEIRGRQLRAKE